MKILSVFHRPFTYSCLIIALGGLKHVGILCKNQWCFYNKLVSLTPSSFGTRLYPVCRRHFLACYKSTAILRKQKLVTINHI